MHPYVCADICGALPPRVTLETSAIILSASLHAWYMRSISSLFSASSALSSIILCYKSTMIFALLRQTRNYRVSCGIQTSQELTIDESLSVVHNNVHDHLWHLVLAGCGHYLHVGVHKVPNCLHLPFQLRINRLSSL